MGPPRDQRGGRRAGALSRKCLSSRRRGRRRYRFGDAPNQRLEAPRRFWRGELLLLPKMNEPGLTTGVRSRSTAAWQKRPASGFGAHVGQVTEGHGFGALRRLPATPERDWVPPHDQRPSGRARVAKGRMPDGWSRSGIRRYQRLSAPLRGSAPAPCPQTSGRAVHAASGACWRGRRWCSSRAR